MGELDTAIAAVEALESCLDNYDSVSRLSSPEQKHK